MASATAEVEKVYPYHAFPFDCRLPHIGGQDGKLLHAVCEISMLKKLQGEEGMSDEEIIAGYSLQEPELSKMKSIVCRGCGVYKCPHNSKQSWHPDNPFRDLQNGRWADRSAAGEELLEKLLPEQRRNELKQQEIECGFGQFPSRKHPLLYFYFKRDGEKRSVDCKIGKRELWINHEKSSQPLTGLGQISEAIEKAIADLLAV